MPLTLVLVPLQEDPGLIELAPDGLPLSIQGGFTCSRINSFVDGGV